MGQGFDFDGVEGFDFDLDLDFDLVLPDLDLVLPDLDLSAWSVEGEDVEWDTWDTGEGDGGQMGTNGDTVEGDGVVEGMVTDGD